MPNLPHTARLRKSFPLHRIRTWVLVGIVIIGCGFIFQVLSQSETKSDWGKFHKLHQPRTVAVEDIQGWMTFEYLNIVFQLPPNYLHDTLQLEASRYPRVTIRRAANITGANLTDFILRIQNAVKNYPR